MTGFCLCQTSRRTTACSLPIRMNITVVSCATLSHENALVPLISEHDDHLSTDETQAQQECCLNVGPTMLVQYLLFDAGTAFVVWPELLVQHVLLEQQCWSNVCYVLTRNVGPEFVVWPGMLVQHALFDQYNAGPTYVEVYLWTTQESYLETTWEIQLISATQLLWCNCGEPPWPRGSVLGLRPPGLEFRILCLEDSVISIISPSSGGSPGPV